MPTYLAPIDLSQNELRNARIQNLASAPSTPVEGQVYYNTVSHKTFTWDGTTWQAGSGATGSAGGDLTGTYPNPTVAAGAITNAKISGSAAIDLSKLATDPLARANHTGTQLAATISDFNTAVRLNTLAELAAPLAPVSLGGQLLNNLATPVAATDAATKGYVDTATTGSAGGDLTGSYPNPTIAAGKIVDSQISATAAIALSKLATDPLARANHTGTQLAATISDFDTQVRTSHLDQLLPATGDLDLGAHTITNLADPVGAQDAATKAYVDGTSQGLDVKASVRAATTANVTLSGIQTIDGVSLAAGNRVLVKNQSTDSANGIYVVASGAWSRSLDADSNTDVTPGLYTFVEEGTANADSGFVLTTDGAVSLGTTSLTFSQFSGAGQVTAGNGLTKTGNSLDVVGTASRITVAADSIDISTAYVGQASIDTVGTVTTGTWQATPVAIAYGGTGAVTATAGRVALGAVGKYTTLNGGTVTDTVVHNLNTLDVQVTLRITGTGEPAVADVTVVDANTVSVSYGSAPTAGFLSITVLG